MEMSVAILRVPEELVSPKTLDGEGMGPRTGFLPGRFLVECEQVPCRLSVGIRRCVTAHKLGGV